jgi:hypothetical protein
VVLTPSGVVTVAAGVFSAAADHFPPLKILLLKASSTVMSISRFWFVVDRVAVCRGCLCGCFLFGSLDFQLDWCIWFDLLFQLPASFCCWFYVLLCGFFPIF